MERVYNLNFNSEEVSLFTFHDGVIFELVDRSNIRAAGLEGKMLASNIICQKMREAVQYRANFTMGSNSGPGRITLTCNHGQHNTGLFDATMLHPSLPLTVKVSVKCPECIGDGAPATDQVVSENDPQPPPANQDRPFKASPIPPFNIFPGHSWR